MLIDVLQRLVDDGNTVLVIEHNLDIVKVADHIIDVGPEGGREGGKIVCKGTPEELIKKYTAISHTAKYLKMEIDHMNKIRKS
jgi:excinuclease ABC subunit A